MSEQPSLGLERKVLEDSRESCSERRKDGKGEAKADEVFEEDLSDRREGLSEDREALRLEPKVRAFRREAVGQGEAARWFELDDLSLQLEAVLVEQEGLSLPAEGLLLEPRVGSSLSRCRRD